MPVRVLPGHDRGAARSRPRAGAPLGHDYSVISLSDRLKPWEVVAERLAAAAAADLVLALYNPALEGAGPGRWPRPGTCCWSTAPRTRRWCVGRDVGGPGERVDA